MSLDSEPAKVLLLLPSLGGGGAERVMVTLAARLDRSRFTPHIAVLERKGPYLDSLPADVPLHDLAAQRVRSAILPVIRLVWKLRPAVVLSNISHLNLMLLASKPLWPRGVRLWVRETIVVSAWMAAEVTNPRVMGWLYRRLYPRADGILCQCDAMLTDLERRFGIPRRKMVRIYNPVEIERIRALAATAANPYPNRGPHLLACGRLIPMKGFDLLVQAMTEVAQAIPAADLTILGEGPCEASLRALAERLGLADKVHFPGFQSNPYPWMQRADLFVLSSRYEGLPNVMLEALALGTPVVGMDCPGGVREILEPCPIGRTTPADDVSQLGGAIVEELGRDAKAAPAEGLESFLDPFRVEHVMSLYEEIFRCSK
ncbi:MAG TPA: glycosyltransferase [Terriglobia bacterium]|nr:glycosyltransferase [Terriglobia bacterium]